MYLIQRIENGVVVLERSFRPSSCQSLLCPVDARPVLYHQLVVNGRPFTTGQAEQFFSWGGADEQSTL